MATTSLIINSTTADGKAMTTVTDVNANALGSVYNEFGRKLNALTNNTFGSVNRLDKENLDAESAPAVEKTTPTITLAPSSATRADLIAARDSTGYYSVAVSYNGDGAFESPKISQKGYVGGKIYNNNELRIYVGGLLTASSTSFANIIVSTKETDTYNAATATFTITEA